MTNSEYSSNYVGTTNRNIYGVRGSIYDHLHDIQAFSSDRGENDTWGLTLYIILTWRTGIYLANEWGSHHLQDIQILSLRLLICFIIHVEHFQFFRFSNFLRLFCKLKKKLKAICSHGHYWNPMCLSLIVLKL